MTPMQPLESENTSLLLGVRRDGSSSSNEDGNDVGDAIHIGPLHVSRDVLFPAIAWGVCGLVWGMLVMYAAIGGGDRYGRGGRLGGGEKELVISSTARARGGSKYDKFQPIGMQIYTGSAPAFLNESSKLIPNPECTRLNSYGSAEGDLECYVGRWDTSADVSQRMDIMRTAVERAHELSDTDDATLKIFIAPEFFWRGKDGAYVIYGDDPDEEGQCGEICQILQGLEEIVEQERFKDWLFVFGTVIASEVLPAEDDYDFLFYNFAPVYKGFDPKKSSRKGKRFLVPKRYLSQIDFLTPRRHFNRSIAREVISEQIPSADTVFNPHDFDHRRYDNSMFDRYKKELSDLGYVMIEYDWFLLDGITLTLEICLDHDVHSALDTYMADVVTGSKLLIPSGGEAGLTYEKIPQHQAQISLVSSAGMSVVTESLALAHNGTIFLQDGLSSEPSHTYWEDECQQGLQFDGGSQVVQRHAVLTRTDVFFEYQLNTAHRQYDIFNESVWKDELRGVFTTNSYPPNINVYEPVKIPKFQLDKEC